MHFIKSLNLNHVVALLVVPLTMLTFSSCADEMNPEDVSYNVSADLSVRSYNPELVQTRKYRHISKEFLSTILDNHFESRSYIRKSASGGSVSFVSRSNGKLKDISYSIKSLPDDSNPLLYVANNEKGGWAIVAGDYRDENQILAYSDEGYFNPDNIDNPELAFWLEMCLSEMRNVEFDDSAINNDGQGQMMKSYPISFDEEYYWVRVPLGTFISKEEKNVDHLLQTKWGQGYPWNYKTPSGCPTGCVAVAASQILYYLHDKIGTPMGLYHIINPSFTNFSDGYYNCWSLSSIVRSDYNSNSNRWSMMPLTNPGQRTLGSDCVGDLMIDVGAHLGMIYTPSGSFSQSSQKIFEPYGVGCDSTAYVFSMVMQSIDDGNPVMIHATSSSVSGGHAWVIDGYNYDMTIHDTQYQWRMLPPDSLSFYENLDYDYVLTEEQKQFRKLSVEEWDIEHHYSTSSSGYVRMNWGWDGEHDESDINNAYYSISPDWKPNAYSRYKNVVFILSNFHQL